MLAGIYSSDSAGFALIKVVLIDALASIMYYNVCQALSSDQVWGCSYERQSAFAYSH